MYSGTEISSTLWEHHADKINDLLKQSDEKSLNQPIVIFMTLLKIKPPQGLLLLNHVFLICKRLL